MIEATITRETSEDDGTYGLFIVRVGASYLTLQSLELPWRDNKINISSIPTGTYVAHVQRYKDYMTYLLNHVPGRSGIFIHRGNWAGDVSLGFASDVEGCILLGFGRAKDSGGQKMITDSRYAFEALMGMTRYMPMTLTVIEG